VRTQRGVLGASTPYVLGIGIVVGLLLAGLAVPFLVADRATTQAVVAGGPGGGPDGPSDVGVTDTTIKVGFSGPDLAKLGNFGFGNIDSGDVEGRFRALVDSVNAKGGINGRTIVPVFNQYDFVTDPAAGAQAACTTMVTDARVFAVVDAGPYPGSGVSCYTDQQIPFLTLNGYTAGSYESGYLFTAFPTYQRSLRDQVAYLDAHSLLDGKTIGVFTDEGSQFKAVQEALVPAIEATGHKVVDIETVNEDATALQQAPAVLSNFKAHNVDFLIVATLPLFAKTLPELAARQGFTPTYAYSDFFNEISDAYGDYGPANNGAIGLTSTRIGEDKTGAPVPAADQACLDRVAANKENLQRGSQPYVIAMYQCTMFDLFVEAATRTGKQLTHAGFVAAAEGIGTIEVPNSANGSTAPGKHDLLDGLRPVTYNSACPCWAVAGDFADPSR
jgi:hypothetical protein